MLDNIGPIIFLGTAFIGVFILYEFRKSSRVSERKSENFWDRERKANVARRKDISALNYLVIPMEELPFIDTTDDELLEYHKTMENLSTLKILNLTGITNTELKEQYGVANLEALTNCDNNYITLVNTISRWGARLIALDYTKEAVTVLEYGLKIGTDVSRNFLMLAELYQADNNYKKIDELIIRASALKSMMKDSIVNKLTEIRNSINE